MAKNTLCLLICENYKREADAVVDAGSFTDVKVLTYPAVCNSAPDILKPLSDYFPSGKNRFGRIFFIGGRCAKFFELPAEGTVGFRPYLQEQCYHLFANKEIIDGYLKDGACLQTPGFLNRWRRCMKEMDLDQKSARKFFRKSADRVLLLDTGVVKNITGKLKEFAGFINMPYESVRVGLDHFRLYLHEIILEWGIEKEKGIAAQALRESEARLNSVFNTITDAAIFLNAGHRIAAVNAAFTKLFGYKTKEISGKTTERLYAGGPVSEAVTSCRSKDGDVFTAEIIESPIQDSMGKTSVSLRIFRHVTERKKEVEHPGTAMVKRSDRRGHERFMIGRTCLVEMNDSEMVELKDISLSGARLNIPRQLPSESSYSVKIFPSIKKEIQLTGTVVWSSPKGTAGAPAYEAGLKFIQLDESTSSSLKQFVESLAS